jgi:hypothetical protein
MDRLRDEHPSLPRLGGAVQVRLAGARSRRGRLPDVDLELHTSSLSVEPAGGPAAAGSTARRPDEFGADLVLRAHHEEGADEDAYSGRMLVTASGGARDRRGQLASFEAMSALDPAALLDGLAALSPGRSSAASPSAFAGRIPAPEGGPRPADADAALALVRSLPVALQVTLAERDIARWPRMLRPEGYRGVLGAEAQISGTLGAPQGTLTAVARGLASRTTPRSAAPIDATLVARARPDRLDLSVGVDDDGRRVLDLGAAASVRPADLLWSRQATAGWSGAIDARATYFRIESVPLLEQFGAAGLLSGRVHAEGLGARPVVDVALDIEDGTLRGLDLPLAHVRAVLSGDGTSEVAVALRQRDGGGTLDATARPSLTFRGGLVPFLDASREQAAEVHARCFDLSSIAPLVEGAVGQLGGQLDGDASLQIRGHEGKVRAEDLDLRGGFSWANGQVAIPAIEQTFRHGSMKIVTANRDDALLVAVRDLSLSPYSGRITGWADISLGAEALLGPPPDAAASAPAPLPLRARAALHIDDDRKISVTYQGAPIGLASGTIEIGARPGKDALEVFVAAPAVTFQLPRTKKRDLQSLADNPDVAVMDRPAPSPGPAEGAPAPPIGRMVVRVGIGDSLDVLMAAPTSPPKGSLLIEREELGVRAHGRPVFVVNDGVTASGRIETTSGRVVVVGKPFFVERGVVTFDGDPANPVLDVLARWDVSDGSTIFVSVTGPARDPRIELRSEPARSESAVLNMILFGREDLGTPSSEPGSSSSASSSGDGTSGSSGGGSTAAAGLAASTLLNVLIDPVNLFGQRFEAKVDTSGNQASVGVVTEIRPNLWAQVNVAPVRNPSNPYADTTELLLDWRFTRRWALRSSVGDRGSTQVDLIWQKKFLARGRQVGVSSYRVEARDQGRPPPAMSLLHEELLDLLMSLDGVRQDPRYHPEGDALYHSLQVFGAALRETRSPQLLAAALLHDVGKALGSPDHDETGAELLDGLVSDRIVWLVRHHLDLLRQPQRARRRMRGQAALSDLEALRRFDLAGRVPGALVIEPEAALQIIMQDQNALLPCGDAAPDHDERNAC